MAVQEGTVAPDDHRLPEREGSNEPSRMKKMDVSDAETRGLIYSDHGTTVRAGATVLKPTLLFEFLIRDSFLSWVALIPLD